MSTGVLLGFLGLVVTGSLFHHSAVALQLSTLGALVVFGLRDLDVLPLPRVGSWRQTPGSWTCSLGPLPGIFAWGFDLGLGFTTSIQYQSWLALALAAFVSQSLLVSVSIMGGYGTARALAVVVSILASHGRTSRTCDVLSQQSRFLRHVIGVTAIGVGLVVALPLVN